jgi:3-mercaptopyruvate sulfurtransferase SseA
MNQRGAGRMKGMVPWRVLAGLAAGVVVLGGCAPNITDADIKPIPITELRKLTLRQAQKPQEKVVALIDPRAAARFDAGHLPGARNLKLPQVPERSSRDPALAAYGHIVVYGTDPASAAARAMTKRLLRVGYDDVRMFSGGTMEWVEKGYTLEVTPGAPEPTPIDGPPEPETP